MEGNMTEPLYSNSTYRITKVSVKTQGRHATPKHGTAELYLVNLKIQNETLK